MHQPIDTAQDFVLGPLRTLPNQPVTQQAITAYKSASPSQQSAWTTAYEKAVANATDVQVGCTSLGVAMAPSESSSAR